MLIRSFEVLLLSLLVAGAVACGDDNPTSSDDGNNSGDGADVTAPAAVTDLRPESPTVTSVALVWTSPGDDGGAGTASEYDVRYSTSLITDQNWDAAIQVDAEPAPKPAGGIETIRVSNLESGKKYHFALKTSDEVPNVSELSNVASDSTLQETAPPDTVTDLYAEGIADGTFRLTWTAPGDDGNLGNASEYDIRYSTSRISVQNWDSATQVDGEPAPKPVGSPDTMLVTGLEDSTNYFFAMKTADEVPNWSAMSNVYAAMANTNNLWVFPDRVKRGSNVIIIYRTPETGMSKLYVYWRDDGDDDPWSRLVIPWEWPPGIHERTWDFTRGGGDYHQYPYNPYTFKLYWSGVVVAEAIAWLEP